mmetsp:Transcript_10545/g.15673  ORF Transcript_10545/g.15673 Transcript_10545/m.15673 type:complete len:169 (-) Transcript_10545:2088-2594(-)
MIKILLGCDGFGEDLKNAIKTHLLSRNKEYEVIDYGCCEYYKASATVATELKKLLERNETAFGMLFCGTGMGVSIIANKFEGISAATCENERAVRCARAISDANILCLGGKFTSSEDGIKMADAFLDQEFVQPPKSCEVSTPEWWSEDVENFLKTSKEGIAQVLAAQK